MRVGSLHAPNEHQPDRLKMAYETGPRRPGDEENYEIVMCVVDEPRPGERNVLADRSGDDGPLMVGTGHDDFVCGNCRTLLAGNMGPEEIAGAPLLKCYACGAYNQVPEE